MACREGNVLGVIRGRARLVEPSRCIGHGACQMACPFDAISLVFGTARRGVDIPTLGTEFQNDVPGIYIAGELGGMGLIRNAITQGLDLWSGIIKRTGLNIRSGERLESVLPDGGGFMVDTNRGQYRTARLLLSIGRRGTPRRLGVPGEEQSKVVYRLVDPEQYRGQQVPVVGGVASVRLIHVKIEQLNE